MQVRKSIISSSGGALKSTCRSRQNLNVNQRSAVKLDAVRHKTGLSANRIASTLKEDVHLNLFCTYR
jgi:hypothetical protein